MRQTMKRCFAFLIAFIFAVTGAFVFNGTGTFVYADVTSVGDEDQDTNYPKGGGVLGEIGVDTSVMPETYDPDSTDNPYGSDVTTLCEMSELVKIDTYNTSSTRSSLYGHNCKLDGSYNTLTAESTTENRNISGPGRNDYIAAANCDVNGSGRDSAVAMVYTSYRHSASAPNTSGTIYMKIYDPVASGRSTEPFVITDNAEAFTQNHLEWNYQIQSQLHIAAGDFDNDTVDEIAVYVPAAEGSAPRVAIYDLTNGVDCADPYNQAAWQNSWNYLLPKTSAEVVECDPPQGHGGTDKYYISNYYNNIDLAAADADNDGSCDLVVSYGASDVDKGMLIKQEIVRSTPSHSVVLYGSNGDDAHGSQMLRDSQELQYGGDQLIRVSFGFGDLDGDGNEEMIMGGQLQSEQSTNYSRVLAKFDYDESSGDMVCEGVQKVNIVDGQWSEVEDDQGHKKRTFASGNGWDGYYRCMPAVNTNIAVGKIFGEQSATRVYMDSVIYSYDDSTFSIIDELDDPSLNDPKDSESGNKGSAVFADMHGMVEGKYSQLDYYEYGASIGNYTGGLEEYITVHRVSQESKNAGGTINYHADASVLVPVENDDNDEAHSLTIKSNKTEFLARSQSGGVTLVPADTDMDSAVAKYTGKHEVTYQNPRVLAVIASAPYFKDVADYDESGNLLEDSVTSYGESTGSEDEYSQNVEIEAGIYTNNTIAFGAKSFGVCDLVGVNINATLGFQYTHDWGNATSRDFDVTYGTAAGEDQVVLISTPTENFTYNVTTGAVDDEGNVSLVTQTQVIPNIHEPVTKVIPLDRYMEIQKRQKSDKLPDITRYLKSKPGYPNTYPKSQETIPAAVHDSWKDVSRIEYLAYLHENNLFGTSLVSQEYDSLADMISAKMKLGDYTWTQPGNWEGAGFGSGSITQTLTAGESDYSRKGYGGYFSLEVGAHFKFENGLGLVEDYEGDTGVHFSVGGDEGMTYHHSKSISCSGTVANMPESAEGYGYDFDWKLMEYMVHDSKECVFPVITYMVKDVKAPPKLPDSITQDFDQTTDSQICLTWSYTGDTPQEFEIYRYKDFPQGGGDELVGTVSGSTYTIRKDEDNHTVTDSNGKVIKDYSFIEDGLTADTKYKYRMKVKGGTPVSESIFSPIIEARTDVSEKPALSLSADNLTIYPDGQFDLSVVLADPDNYEKSMDYQWQVYDKKKLSWTDMPDKTKKAIRFKNCKASDAGQYRCRVNLVRKHESSPQYISAYTNACEVKYSKRDVTFDPIAVFEGTGESATNTGILVGVKNSSSTSTSKPTGKVTFNLEGPNGILTLNAQIDEQTGVARIESIEDELGSLSQEAFVNGGYLVTAEYEGDYVFNPAEDEEEYHYLRSITACDFLSMESTYAFGKDVMPTTKLFRYSEQEGGAIHREDITDQMSKLKLYATNAEGQKGDAVAEIDLSETDGIAKIPLNTKLKKRAYIEAYVEGSDDPVAYQIVRTAQRKATIYLSGKLSGAGEHLLKLYSFDDITVTGDVDLSEKNIVGADGGDPQSLEDLLIFKYYEDSGDYMFDSTEAESHKSDFIPARYKVDLAAKDSDSKALYETFYDFNNPPKAEYLVVGSYYEVTASASDPGAGSVRMISPILLNEIDKVGFSGGSKITLKALPAEGFKIKRWVIEDGQGGTQTQSGGDLLIYTLRSDSTVNSDGQVNITAVFEPKDQTLTYEAKGQGEITVEPFFTSGSTVLEGTQMQFTANAAEGWHFKEWRWDDFGGDSSISTGNSSENGVNSKTYTMGDKAAAVYAVFFRDTIDIDLDDHLTASYINDGSNPLEDIDKEIEVNKGREVPKGTTVRVLTAPGFEPAKDAEWIVTVTTPDGTSQIDIREYMSGGREGCEFDLPADVTDCSVQLDTVKGYYSIGLEGTDVKYNVSLDGTRVPESQYDQKLSRIEAGTLVEIEAIPDRGKLFDKWLVDGDEDADAPQDYFFTLNNSVTLEAKVKDDEDYTIKLKAAHEGTGEYTITDHNGEVVSGTFGIEEVELTAYKGENLTISGSPGDAAHILTAVKMNGERQDLVDGVFTLESITEDAEFICDFQPTTYCVVSFDNKIGGTAVQILDSDGSVLDEGETIKVGSGVELNFSLVADKGQFCFVRNGDTQIDYYDVEEQGEDKFRYYYKFTVNENTTLTIDDFEVREIDNLEKLNAFMTYNNELNEWNLKERLIGIITADIEVQEGESVTACHGAFQGTLDGQGHTISGIKLNGGLDENNKLKPYDGRSNLFEEIGSTGVVKDLIIEGYDAYVDLYWTSSSYGNALLTENNNGRISGVTLKNCSLSHYTSPDQEPLNKPEVAGIAVTNTGTIEACSVIGLKLQTGRMEIMGNEIGCAIALKNHVDTTKGEINGCYVEELQISGSYHYGEDYMEAFSPIIADDMVEWGSGSCNGNYFRLYDGGSADDSFRAKNVTTITDDPDKPAFAANLAYHMNHEASELWGINRPASAEDDGETLTPQIIPLSYGGEDCKAPVRGEFKYNGTDYALYLYPGECKLPGNENFGDDLAFWQVGENGTIAYPVGYEFVDILEDTTFIGLSSFDSCVAQLYGEDGDGNKTQIVYYSDLEDALAAAKATELENPHLDIVGDCSMNSGSFTVKEGMTMTICDGVAFTLKRAATINNKGTFTCAEGSTFHKYGTMVNTGTINVDGTFWNYGSKLTNTGEGTINHRQDIKCNPHLYGEWQSADYPNDDGTWTNIRTCDVCTNTEEKNIEPNPEADLVDHIEVFRYPTKAEYHTGDTFDTTGLMIIAVMDSGSRALVTEYNMTISDGTSDPVPISNGDVLDKHGAKQITVNYEGFTCSFPIMVRSPITGIAIADGEREVAVNETIQLTAVTTPPGVQVDIQWSSDNTNVATVDENGVVTGVSGGQAKITATVDDMKASVTIIVHEAAASLELDAYEITVPKDGNGLVAARVVPATADGEITWTVDDQSIAGLIVTDPETGETSIVDSTTTKLSQGNASEASAYIAVAGVEEGQTTVTASIRDARGLTIHKDCTVEVREADAAVRILYNGEVVSGKTVTVDASEGTIQMRAESSVEGDTLDWDSIDDLEDPVIYVRDNGQIELVRSGIAVVQVMSDSTGISDYCILNVVRMPASITLSATDLHMAKGTVKMLTATMKPDEVDGTVKWSSSDESVAKVSEGGVITGEAEGLTIITAQSSVDPDIKAECQVYVYEPEIQIYLSKDSYFYDGKNKIPKVTVTSGNMILADGITGSNERVMLIYEGSLRAPGEHAVTAIGRDEGMGMATTTYQIVIRPTKFKSLSGQTKAIKVKWAKRKKGVVSGYQVQVATDKAFTKNKKSKNIKSYKTYKTTITNLKAKKKYFVRVRTYKRIGGTKIFSEWTDVRHVKTK